MNPTKLDHVAYWVADRDPVAEFVTTYLGMHVIDRTETFTLVGSNARRGKLTLFDADGPREPGAPERPLLNHLAVLVDSADEHIAAANDLGVEVDNIVDAANTYAVFLWGPERVRVEYVEHKPTFSLT